MVPARYSLAQNYADRSFRAAAETFGAAIHDDFFQTRFAGLYAWRKAHLLRERVRAEPQSPFLIAIGFYIKQWERT
jgi:hypothetical protein